MSGTTAERKRARFVGFASDGRKKLAYACGQTICDERTMQARHVGFRDGKPLYATSGECFKRLGVEYVDDPCGVARRISTVLHVQLRLFVDVTCFDDNLCPQAEITYDQHSGTWSGTVSIGGHSTTISMECAPSGVGYDYLLRIADICIGPPLTPAVVPLILGCEAPFRAGGEAPQVVPPNCCGNIADGSLFISATVTGLQKPRYIARFVGFVGRKKLFAVADCCPAPEPCLEVMPCCGCEVSPNQWTFDISGITDIDPPNLCISGCGAYNGTWTLTRIGTDVCLWQVNTPNVCTPGPPWRLGCDEDLGVWTLSSSSLAGAFTYQKSMAEWDCLGPNEMTKVGDHGACNGAPGTVTVTPV